MSFLSVRALERLDKLVDLGPEHDCFKGNGYLWSFISQLATQAFTEQLQDALHEGRSTTGFRGNLVHLMPLQPQKDYLSLGSGQFGKHSSITTSSSDNAT